MTRFIHDQFAKQYLTELLTSFGQVETSKEIASEVREIDVLFLPSPQIPDNRDSLGLLGRIATTPAIIEPFRNPVTRNGILTCIGKAIAISEQLARQTHQSDRPTETPSLRLWILSPTASPELLATCQATADESQWMKGIYFLPEIFQTAIIAIHQLPRTPETLWVRILGRGRVQQQAIQELEALPENHPWRSSTIELICNLLAILELRHRERQELDSEEQELIMQLSPIYLQRLEEATQQGIERGIEQGIERGIEQGIERGIEQGIERGIEQGIERGIEQGIERGIEQGTERERRNTLETLMVMRFGEIDSQLARIIPALVALPPTEFTPLLLQLSREELLARF